MDVDVKRPACCLRAGRPSGSRESRGATLARTCSTCRGRLATRYRDVFVEHAPTQHPSRVNPAGRYCPRPARYWEVRIFWTYRRVSFCEGPRPHPGSRTRESGELVSRHNAVDQLWPEYGPAALQLSNRVRKYLKKDRLPFVTRMPKPPKSAVEAHTGEFRRGRSSPLRWECRFAASAALDPPCRRLDE